MLSRRHNESEKRLPKSCLVLLCKFEPVLRWTKECDNLLYQTLVDMLIPNVLRPIPSKFNHLKDLKRRTFSKGDKSVVQPQDGIFFFLHLLI